MPTQKTKADLELEVNVLSERVRELEDERENFVDEKSKFRIIELENTIRKLEGDLRTTRKQIAGMKASTPEIAKKVKQGYEVPPPKPLIKGNMEYLIWRRDLFVVKRDKHPVKDQVYQQYRREIEQKERDIIKKFEDFRDPEEITKYAPIRDELKAKWSEIDLRREKAKKQAAVV